MLNNILAQYLAQQQPGVGFPSPMSQPAMPPPQFAPTPAPQIVQPQSPQIAPISPLMPGQPSNMQPLPGGTGPGMASMGEGALGKGFGDTMLNGMFGPAGSSAAALGANASLGQRLGKSLLAMFL